MLSNAKQQEDLEGTGQKPRDLSKDSEPVGYSEPKVRSKTWRMRRRHREDRGTDVMETEDVKESGSSSM